MQLRVLCVSTISTRCYTSKAEISPLLIVSLLTLDLKILFFKKVTSMFALHVMSHRLNVENQLNS